MCSLVGFDVKAIETVLLCISTFGGRVEYWSSTGHECGFCGLGRDVVKCFCGADLLRCGEMVTSHFAVKSTLISLLLLNRQNLFPVSNNSCPMCASIHVASK